MAEIGSISSSSPAQAFQRPNNTGSGDQGQNGGSTGAAEDRVQLSSDARAQSVQATAQEAAANGSSPTVDQRIEANADPARESIQNQEITSDATDFQEANTENTSAPPEQDINTVSREQAEQDTANGALSSAETSVQQRGQNVNQLA